MPVKCCFCGRELPRRSDWNNPEPLNQEPQTVCCSECNEDYVVPVRRIVWKHWVTNDECSQLLDYFQNMPLEKLKALLRKYNNIHTQKDFQEFLTNIELN